MNLLDQALGQIACAIPGATRIFHQHKLDFCCGGQQSLRDAAAKRGIDADMIAAELNALESTAEQKDWRYAVDAELIEHILQRYHEVHRTQLPELIRLAQRVETVHSARADCPQGLAALLGEVALNLESHMQKEEKILFPLLIAGRRQTAQQPIAVMRFEHDQHGESLQSLAELTHDFTLPEDACNTWKALYAGLLQLKEDLMQHIHLENNILFQRAN